MYRQAIVKVVVADDSNLANKTERELCVYQTRDLEAGGLPTIRIAPGDEEIQVVLGNIAVGYFIHVQSDYPVQWRLRDSDGLNPFTPGNVQPTNLGAVLPPQCFLTTTSRIPGLYLSPIDSAGQTANVTILISGDPSSAY
jgi:hypothetical protein